MKHRVLTIGFSLTAFIVLCTTTNPKTAPSFVLVLPFIFLFITMVASMRLILQRKGWVAARSWQVSFFVAGIPIGLLVLQSVGQLTMRDGLTILAFFGIGYFYVARILKRQAG
jgi:hypothetical protein